LVLGFVAVDVTEVAMCGLRQLGFCLRQHLPCRFRGNKPLHQ